MSLASLDPIPLFREVHPEVHQPHSAHLHKSVVHKPLWRKLMVKSGMTYTGLQFFNLVDLMQGLLFSCKIPQTFPPEMATFFFLFLRKLEDKLFDGAFTVGPNLKWIPRGGGKKRNSSLFQHFLDRKYSIHKLQPPALRWKSCNAIMSSSVQPLQSPNHVDNRLFVPV